MCIEVKDNTVNSSLLSSENFRFYLGVGEVSYRNLLLSEAAISSCISNDLNFDPILIISCHF